MYPRSTGVNAVKIPRPDRTEAAEYYFRYIDQVQGEDVCRTLETQRDETVALLRGVSDEKSLHRYAPDKWSIRQVVGHVSDAERLFVSRAFWFARGFDTPLPSFDQNTAMAAAGFDDRSWTSLVDEFRAVRDSTLSFFQSLPSDAWTRRGIASDNPFTVRALAYVTIGHVAHHLAILRQRYLTVLILALVMFSTACASPAKSASVPPVAPRSAVVLRPPELLAPPEGAVLTLFPRIA